MIYRITGGIALVLIGTTYLGIYSNNFITGIFALIAGIALLGSI